MLMHSCCCSLYFVLLEFAQSSKRFKSLLKMLLENEKEKGKTYFYFSPPIWPSCHGLASLHCFPSPPCMGLPWMLAQFSPLPRFFPRVGLLWSWPIALSFLSLGPFHSLGRSPASLAQP